MSVYLHVTLEIHAAGLQRFLDAMEKTAVPFLEKQGWRLSGAFVQRSGRLGNVIDLWELDDFQHYDTALKAFAGEPSFPAFKEVLEQTVISETVVFCDAASYMRPSARS
ncbi:MAG: NIPSNAP family protein [Caulobacterales bacterium]|nr:NIPSNAP family protein [Caulobacterales bacterium]